jgi:hypothetical membrane protein
MGTAESIEHDSAVQTQSRAVAASLGAAGVSAVIALLVFRGGSVPFSGDLAVGLAEGFPDVRSVGALAAVVGGVLGSLAFVVAYAQSLAVVDAASGSAARPSLARRVLDTVALLLTHLGIWLVLCLGLFAILQRAFIDPRLDALTASAFVSGAAAVAVYSMQASGSSITAFRVSTLLTIFIGSGMMVSIVTAPDPDWWRSNFSALGTFDGFSGTIFNFTLLVTGSVLVTLSDYLTADLREWARRQPAGASARVWVVGAGVATIGGCLAGVGVFPSDRFPLPHGIVAVGLAVVFAALAASLPWLLPGFPRMFFVVGYGAIGLLATVTVLYIPVGLYGQTALELVGAAMVLGWTVILIRTVGALRSDAEAAAAGEPRVRSALR